MEKLSPYIDKKRSRPSRFIFVSLFFLLSLNLVAPSLAFADDDDEFFQNFNRRSSVLTQKKSYLGSRDEQQLEVLSVLPQPSRSPDGTPAASLESDDSETPAATD